MISVVINADTRKGFSNQTSLVGEFENGQPNGTRSSDFLTEGVKQKMNFFRGYEKQCVLYIDIHEPLPIQLLNEISDIVYSYGNNSKLIFKDHDRTKHRWNDYIYLEALRLAEGEYVAHFDNDGNAFRSDNSKIIRDYLLWLNGQYKFVCQSVPMNVDWYWVSTQFFICKRETLEFDKIEKSFDNKYLESHYGRMRYDPYPCCLEHTLGLIVKDKEVLYPQREIDSYIIFCWWKYESGLLKKLNEMPYKEVKDYIISCGKTSSSW